MELNSILFPAPIEDKKLELPKLKDKLIFIPKKEEDGSTFHIPCYYRATRKRTDSNKFFFYFHGNAEDIFNVPYNLEIIRKQLPYNILAMEYPGYSIYYKDKSSQTIEKDSLIVYDFFVNTLGIKPQDIIICGRSIGSGAACYLAANRTPAAVVLISAFTSIKETVKSLVGVFNIFVADRFVNITSMEKITCPVFFIHGQKDNLIPYSHSIELSRKCKGPYELVFPDNMDHNNYDFIDFIENLVEFCKRHNLTNFSSKDTFIMPKELLKVPDYIEKSSQNDYISKLFVKLFKSS